MPACMEQLAWPMIGGSKSVSRGSMNHVPAGHGSVAGGKVMNETVPAW